MTLKSFFLDLLPTPLVWIIARPYVAGDSMTKAITKVDELWKTNKIMSTVDLLGEDVKSTEEVEQMVQIYLDLLDGLKNKAQYVSVSLKPTALGVNFSEDLCVTNLKRILDKAKTYGISITMDMENAPFTDTTLKLYHQLHSEYANFGTVLQTRLFRTEKDIQELPANSHIRLCIGIYREPKDIALQSKDEMKAKLVSYVEPMLDKGHFIAVATHDEPTLRKIFDIIDKRNVSPAKMEFQFLLGVPREKIQNEIQAKGFNVRNYVPFATKKKYATKYALRRFDENPRMAVYVINNLLGQRWFQILFGAVVIAVGAVSFILFQDKFLSFLQPK